MIDIRTEELVPIRDVPRLLPKRRNSRPIHVSAVYRWAGRGRAGRRLETIKIAGTRYTSIEALQRFSDNALTHVYFPTQTKAGAERVARQVSSILGASEKK